MQYALRSPSDISCSFLRRSTAATLPRVIHVYFFNWITKNLNSYLQQRFRSINNNSTMSLIAVIGKLWQEYSKTTPKKLKIIDAYLLYIFLTGVIQFVYCCLVGTFPFNSFLSGFISCVSCFILAVCLRLQVNPQNKSQFYGISPERGFADFIFAHVILHIVVMNFIG